MSFPVERHLNKHDARWYNTRIVTLTLHPMNIQIEALFTAALGLQPPWQIANVELNTGKRRIDFEVEHSDKRAACPVCGTKDQLIHDRVHRSWRHLDFFQFEAWLHADVPRVKCGGCGKTTQLPVPWAREGSGFTLLFEALGLSLCRELPVQQAANLMNGKARGQVLHNHINPATVRFMTRPLPI